MANELRTEVEQVKEQEDVKRTLKQTSTVKPEEKPSAETKDKLEIETVHKEFERIHCENPTLQH